MIDPRTLVVRNRVSGRGPFADPENGGYDIQFPGVSSSTNCEAVAAAHQRRTGLIARPISRESGPGRRLDEGSWKLEPTEDGRKTTVIYDLFTDGGGGLPAFVINMANRQSVNDLFQAIRKQVILPKYSQKNPPD